MGTKELILIATIGISLIFIVYSFKNIEEIKDENAPKSILRLLTLFVPIVGFFVSWRMKNNGDVPK